MNPPRILIAGVGDIFKGDQAFGIQVAQRLNDRALPTNVEIQDFGTRGYDLANALTDHYDVTIIVDALPLGDEPGTLYVIEPNLDKFDPAHESDGEVTGASPKRVFVVGCEPEPMVGEPEERIGLSAPVDQSVDEAVRVIESLLKDILKPQPA